MNWYCIRSATRQERKAADALKERKFETFTPIEERWTQLRSRKVKIGRPLFAGYLFIHCAPASFDDVREVPFVHQFVCLMKSNGQLEPMAFPDECIGDLMSQQATGAFDLTRTTPKRSIPKKGERAQVTGGKWRGYVAEVLSTSAKSRKAVVMLETINDGRVRMELNLAHLDAA